MSRKNNHWGEAQALSNKYFQELQTYMYTITKNSMLSKEIVSAVFYKIYADEKLCRHIAEPAWGYLAGMAMNEWYMMLRKEKSNDRKEAGYEMLYAEQWQESPEEAAIYRELMEQLNERVRQLPPRMREVFELLRESYTTREVAEKMGITEQTVRNTKTNAINILRDELTRLGLLQLLWLLW
ncbi:sigma-70 family RNA polymerase sigma factor [Paraflavitalea soli]|uniref:Sigma-70 family RNA polymerase sigma factor n=1 Tax=Paraflavitalea soli TaxID=2315862 RepID=A0A3B7MM25_9BACT|nr:sigma-70 family RNA polymerase sigma factor [Paraflavitalea soli]AXY74777.1 sigma-70 family RNA polymerase sigma factor [Paraflavitalea soli]